MSSGRQQQQQHTQSTSTPGSSATSVSHQHRTGTPSLTPGDWIIGHNLQISTVTGQVHTGALLIYDPQSQIVVLSSQTRSVNGGVDVTPSNSLFDIQIIKVGSIKDIHRLPAKQDGFKPYEAKPITLQDMKNREQLAQKRAQEDERRLGVGVTVEGQKIYDAFAKTLPVKWRGKSIVVAEEALINPPYTVDSVVSVDAALNRNGEENGGKGALTRIKHILQQERAKLGLNAVIKGPVEGVRKGG